MDAARRVWQPSGLVRVVKGGAKKTAGRASGDPRLEAEGYGDQAKGNLKQAGPRSRTPSSTDPPGARHLAPPGSPARCPGSPS